MKIANPDIFRQGEPFMSGIDEAKLVHILISYALSEAAEFELASLPLNLDALTLFAGYNKESISAL